MPPFEFTDENILKSQDYFLPCVRRWFSDSPILFVEAKGAILKDNHGREYIDLHSSHGCATLLGYTHPKVVEAIKEQVDQIYGISVEFPTKPSIELASTLIDATPKPLNRVYFCNSGAEAVEAGLFLSKKYTEKSEMIALYGAFHGRTHGARSLLGFSGLKRGVGPFLSGIVRIPSYYCYRCQLGLEYPTCELQCAKMLQDTLRYATDGEPAVFIAEPIQGTAGNIPAPDGYFQEVKKILDQHGILLFMDEIYTAFGSTGKRFCHEHYGVIPDIMTMSKTLGNGLPISALMTREEISASFAPPSPTMYFTTFGGNPLMAAGALAVVKTILKEKPWERAERMGAYWMEGWRNLQEKYEIIGDVRGKGVMIGIELVKDRKTKEPAQEESVRLVAECSKRGLIVPGAMGWLGNCIRMNPPVIMTEDQVDHALDVLDQAFAVVSK